MDLEEKHSEKNKTELIREALRRAKRNEREEYEEIIKSQVALGERIFAIWKEHKELCESSERNKCPENPEANQTKRASEMSNAEFSESMKQFNEYISAYFAWSNESIRTATKQTALVNEIIELITELCTSEAKEKWLLLSIALRSQPNLLKYLQ